MPLDLWKCHYDRIRERHYIIPYVLPVTSLVYHIYHWCLTNHIQHSSSVSVWVFVLSVVCITHTKAHPVLPVSVWMFGSYVVMFILCPFEFSSAILLQIGSLNEKPTKQDCGCHCMHATLLHNAHSLPSVPFCSLFKCKYTTPSLFSPSLYFPALI